MERNFKRISDGLKLPQESRERIRSQLASYQKQSEDIPMKKSTLKSRVPLIAVAVVMMMALTLTQRWLCICSEMTSSCPAGMTFPCLQVKMVLLVLLLSTAPEETRPPLWKKR